MEKIAHSNAFHSTYIAIAAIVVVACGALGAFIEVSARNEKPKPQPSQPIVSTPATQSEDAELKALIDALRDNGSERDDEALARATDFLAKCRNIASQLPRQTAFSSAQQSEIALHGDERPLGQDRQPQR